MRVKATISYANLAILFCKLGIKMPGRCMQWGVDGNDISYLRQDKEKDYIIKYGEELV